MISILTAIARGLLSTSRSASLVFRQLKHKVFGKAFAVSLNRTNERAGLGAMQASKIPVEHYLFGSYQVYALLDEAGFILSSKWSFRSYFLSYLLAKYVISSTSA